VCGNYLEIREIKNTENSLVSDFVFKVVLTPSVASTALEICSIEFLQTIHLPGTVYMPIQPPPNILFKKIILKHRKQTFNSFLIRYRNNSCRKT
jgi:hypothetical protein